MFRPLSHLCVASLCLLFLPACAHLQKRTQEKHRAGMKKAMAEARQRPLLVGRITLVNVDDRFVLIDAASAQTPRAGSTWRCYSNGTVSAELRFNGIRRRSWVIADIVSGLPQTGDAVLQPAEAESASAPRAELVRRDLQAPRAEPPPVRKRWLNLFGLG